MCSYQDILDYLNLTKENSVFKVTRPVLDYTHPTIVELDIILYAILAVVGADFCVGLWFITWTLPCRVISSYVCVCVFVARLRKHRLSFPSSGRRWWVNLVAFFLMIEKQNLLITVDTCFFLIFSLIFPGNSLQIWKNERISWDPDKFCGITQISVPTDMLWRPDLFIYEMWACSTHRH